MKKNNKPITIEDLAVMIKRGFDDMATKEDLNDAKGTIGDIVEELDTMHTDIRHIRSTTDALVHSDIAQDVIIEDLTSRVHRLEQKAGHGTLQSH